MKKAKKILAAAMVLLAASSFVFTSCDPEVPEENIEQTENQTEEETTGENTSDNTSSDTTTDDKKSDDSTDTSSDKKDDTAAKEYTVTFDKADGSDTAKTTATVKENDKAAKPEDPARTGYTFGGWFAKDAETAFDFATAITADTTLTAKWTAVKYTITYTLAEGETNAATNPTEYTVESDDITLAAPTGTEEKPNFVAWHKDSAAGETVTTIKKGSTGNLTLVSEFTDKTTFSVTYYNGETVLDTVSVVEGGPIENKTIEVTGYDFAGWYSDSACTTSFDFDASSVTAAISVYGKYTIKSFKVTIDGKEQSVVYGETAKKPEDPEKEGYTFKGWFAEGSETSFDFSTTISSNVTLTAKWEAVSYKIEYELNEGTNAADAATSYTIESAAITLPTPTRTGYTFVGWYTTEDFTGDTVSTIAKGSTGDVKYYAKWNIDTYTVTFDSNGGTTVAEQTITYGEKVTVPAEPVKACYTFDGWYTDDNSFDFETIISSDTELKADWKAIDGAELVVLKDAINCEEEPGATDPIKWQETDSVNGAVSICWGAQTVENPRHSARIYANSLSGASAGDYLYFTVSGKDACYQIDNQDWVSYGVTLLDAKTKTEVENSKNPENEKQYVVTGNFAIEITAAMKTDGIEFHGAGVISAAYYVTTVSSNNADTVVLLNEIWSEDWNPKVFEATKFANVTEDTVISMVVSKDTDRLVGGTADAPDYSECYALIQFLDYSTDPAGKFGAGTATGATIGTHQLEGMFQDSDPNTKFYTVTYKPTSEEWAKIKTSGLGIQAHGTMFKKIELK